MVLHPFFVCSEQMWGIMPRIITSMEKQKHFTKMVTIMETIIGIDRRGRVLIIERMTRFLAGACIMGKSHTASGGVAGYRIFGCSPRAASSGTRLTRSRPQDFGA